MTHPLVVSIGDDVPYDVNVMRPNKFGNPFVIGPGGSRYDVIAMHHHWLMRGVAAPTKDLGELTGKVLACCCDGKPCHADTLARMANNPFTIKAYT